MTAWLQSAIAAAVVLASTSAASQPLGRQTVARNLVQAGMIRSGDKVLVTGSVRDATLLEDIAVEVMKVGAYPLIAISSDRLTRRSFTEVPAKYDAVTSPLSRVIVDNFDAQIAVDVGEAEDLLADVPPVRITARAKANEPIIQAVFKKNIRFVNLGNGLYPTTTISRRLGVSQPAISAAFWKAASVNPSTLRATGESLRTAFGKGRVVTITAPNGTNISFRSDAGRAIVSDGALTEEKVKRGAVGASTWLPAGELLLPPENGSANGKIVFDKFVWHGRMIRDLTLTFKEGALDSMTASNDLGTLKVQYDAAGGAKNRFGGIDVGLNPETRLPLGTGRIIWTAPGSVIFFLGDNRGVGGSNVSDFSFAAQLGPGATVMVDATPIIEKGVIRKEFRTAAH